MPIPELDGGQSGVLRQSEAIPPDGRPGEVAQEWALPLMACSDCFGSYAVCNME